MNAPVKIVDPVRRNQNLSTKCRYNYAGHATISRCRNIQECDACRKHHTEHWSMRCGAEGIWADYTVFGTLTLNDENLHRGFSADADGDQAFKNYIKALRRLGVKLGFTVKYIACFERGDKTGRPHWHVILFFRKTGDKLVLPDWPLNVRANLPVWRYGFSQYEIPRSRAGLIEYTMGYIAKKGGRLLRPSNGVGKEVLIRMARMLGRNRRPLMKDQYGIRIRLPGMYSRKKTALNFAGDKTGKMKEFLLPASHDFVPEMIEAYCEGWAENHSDEPNQSWKGVVGGDYLST